MLDVSLQSLLSLGNLLDNAIRSVTALEPDKRVISFSVRAERAFLSINSHNYYATLASEAAR